jgi:hypothetical protein
LKTTSISYGLREAIYFSKSNDFATEPLPTPAPTPSPLPSPTDLLIEAHDLLPLHDTQKFKSQFATAISEFKMEERDTKLAKNDV